MSLRLRITIVLATCVAVLLAALILAHRFIIARAYEGMEQDDIRAELQDARRLIGSDLEALDVLLLDWSSWDATYEYMEARDPSYVVSNLPANILDALRVDAIVFRAPDGGTITSRARDAGGKPVEIPGLTSGIPPGDPLLAFQGDDGVRGLIDTAQGPMLAVSRPVLRSDDAGPARGALVMARRFDQEQVAAIGTRLDLGLTIHPLDVTGRPADVTRAQAVLGDDADAVSVDVVDDRVVAYGYLRDLADRPLAILRADQERTIVAQSARTLRALVLTVAGTGVLLVALVALTFDVAVLRRLVGLRSDMAAIGRGGGPPRARVRGDDEVAAVASGVNAMLDRLDAAAAERIRLLQTVTDQQRLADAAFREMDQGLIVLDGQGVCTASNPASARMLETPAERIIGRHISELLPALGPADEGTRSTGPQLYEVGGRSLAVSRPVQDRAGGLSVVVLRDVTEVLDVERLKRDLVATVSHELRTPLTAIKGTVDLLDAGDAGALSDVQTRLVSLLRTNADRLRLIVDDLLDIGALDGSRVELDRTDVDVAEVARRVVDDLAAPAAEGGVSVAVTGEPRLLAVVDAQRIRQVIDNLVQNALKFTPRGGHVEVSVCRLGSLFEIAVRDNGIGIPPEECERVFEKFYRTKRSAQVARGTGLGLPIARSIVELHGGTLRAESDGRTGTVMRAEIPLAPAVAPSSPG